MNDGYGHGEHVATSAEVAAAEAAAVVDVAQKIPEREPGRDPALDVPHATLADYRHGGQQAAVDEDGLWGGTDPEAGR